MSELRNQEENTTPYLNEQNQPEVNSNEYFENVLGTGEIEIVLHDSHLFARYLNSKSHGFAYQGKYEEAIDLLKFAILQESSWDTLYFDLGYLYSEIRQYDLALENYNKVLRINPIYKDIYYNIAVSYYNIAHNISFNNSNKDSSEDKIWDLLQQAKENLELHYENEGYSIKSIEFLAQINQELGHNKSACDLYLYLSRNVASHESYYLDKILEIDPGNIEILYKKATLFIENNDYSGALGCYKKLAKLDPNSVDKVIKTHIADKPNSTELLTIRGLVALELNKTNSAIHSFQKVINTKLENNAEIFAEDYFNLAKALMKGEYYLKTLKYCNKAIEAGLRSEELFILIINASLPTGNNSIIEVSLKSIVDLDSEQPIWSMMHAKFLHSSNRQIEAKDICSSVSKKFPNYYNKCKDAFWACMESNDLSAAGAFADNLIFLDITNPVSHINMGYVLNKKGDFAQAIFHFEEATKLGANHDNLKFELARAYLGSHKPQLALNYFAQIESEEIHNCPECLMLKAKACLELKKYSDAQFFFDKILKEDEDNLYILWLKSQALEGQGYQRQMSLCYNKILEINERLGTKNYFSEAKFKIAMIHYSKEQYLFARMNLEEAIKNNPNFSEAYKEYNNISVLVKKEVEALGFYKNLLKLNENNEQAHLSKAELLIKMKSNKAAKIPLEEVLKINPSNEFAKELLQNIIKEEAPSISERKFDAYEDSSEAHVKSSDLNSTPTKKSKASSESSENNSPNIGKVTPKRSLDLSTKANEENDETPSKKLGFNELQLDDLDETSDSASSEVDTTMGSASLNDLGTSFSYLNSMSESDAERSIFGDESFYSENGA